jgi:hypothetical protein
MVRDTQINVRTTAELRLRLEHLAKLQRRTLSALVEMILDEYAAKHDKPGRKA